MWECEVLHEIGEERGEKLILWEEEACMQLWDEVSVKVKLLIRVEVVTFNLYCLLLYSRLREMFKIYALYLALNLIFIRVSALTHGLQL